MSATTKEVIIICPDDRKEIISAELNELGFEGIWEDGDKIHVYADSETFKEKDLYDMLMRYGMENNYSLQTVVERNWNAEWESSFTPFTIDDKVRVHASFHPKLNGFKHQIEINPQMSFGTGHHETTELVMRLMLDMDLDSKHVLDMGCGTAILSILAHQMGASKVLAIDNDANSVENALENVKYNDASSVKCIAGDVEAVEGNFDVVLSNITKNINLSLLPTLAKHVKKEGYVVISGFLDFDRDEMVAETQKLNLVPIQEIEKNRWQGIKLQKQ